MQASKIMPGTVYAIRHDNALVRFRVAEVVTARFQATGSPHDYRSTVRGRVVEGGTELTVEPAAVLGLYEDHAELVERARVERESVDAAKRARKEAAEALWRSLYLRCGLALPNERESYKLPFRVSNGERVEISAEGVALLSAAAV